MRWRHDLKSLARKLNRSRAERELDEENRAHLEMKARCAARRRFGGLLLAKESSREVRGFTTMYAIHASLSRLRSLR
jgi:hypothetical protein